MVLGVLELVVFVGFWFWGSGYCVHFEGTEFGGLVLFIISADKLYKEQSSYSL